VRPFTEANVHAPARAQDFERTAIALSKFGRLPVNLVERALLDQGEDMILVLAKTAGCSWTTVKELMLMYIADRNLQHDDLVRVFERYKRLTTQTARNIIDFCQQRVNLRILETSETKIASTERRLS